MSPARDDSLSPSRSPTPIPVPEELSRPNSSYGARSPPRGEKRRYDGGASDYRQSDRRHQGRDRHEGSHSKKSRRDGPDDQLRNDSHGSRSHRGHHESRDDHDPRSYKTHDYDRKHRDSRSHKSSDSNRAGHEKRDRQRQDSADIRGADQYTHYRRQRQERHTVESGSNTYDRGLGSGGDPRNDRAMPRSGNDGHEYDSRDGGRDHIQSVPTKDHPSPETTSARLEAKSRFSSKQQTSSKNYRDTNPTLIEDDSPTRPSDRMKSNGEPLPTLSIEEASSKDVEVSIEERRKSREAVKARLKAQGESNAISGADQADGLDVATPSRPSTPHALSERSASFSAPSAPSPQTPLAHEGMLGSPEHVQISKEAESAYTAPTSPSSPHSVEEPFAADYDPTADMEEDRHRQLMRNAGHGMSAAAYDETKEDAKQLLPLKAAAEAMQLDQKASGQGNPNDDDDDVDMFATESPSKMAQAPVKSKNSAVPTVQPGDFVRNAEQENANVKDGYFDPLPGEVIHGRYRVQKTLGKGTFASVIRCEDIKDDKLVAIKVIKNNDYMKELGRSEIKNLKRINDADPEDKRCIVRFLGEFMHRQHLCLVFENLNINLRELIKKHGRNHGLHYSAVRRYARQMFLALDHLHKCETVHADLKPDNIIVDEDTSKLKVCDLGSAAELWQLELAPYLASRFYRAPEIMLGVPYGCPIDIWSIGCTLFELYTAKILFTGTNNNEMLRSMQETRGKLNNNMIKRAELWGQHFTEDFLFRSFERDKMSGTTRERQINFKLPTPGKDIKARVFKTMHPQADDAEKAAVGLLVDLLEKCLQTNPEKRMTPKEALQHPFVAHSLAAQQVKTREKAAPVAATAASKLFVPRSVLNMKKKAGGAPL